MRRAAASPASRLGCRTTAVRALVVAALACGACRGSSGTAGDEQFRVSISPEPPRVGHAAVSAELLTAGGEPVSGAKVRVEGNMNHAGMKPSLAVLVETAPGHYRGTLEFTMGGDWILLLEAQLPDGRRVEHRLDVPGVRGR